MKFALRCKLWLLIYLIFFVLVVYSAILRPLIFTSFTTNTVFLDSLKTTSKITSFFTTIFSFVLLTMGYYLISS
ncbi:putative integral membrane protein [Theileria parva strain Muguga]|uniref:putative integral membrane protein n=1 Tax=Theileria parva strain Muguga TaxID=333668 RepID=UPI001C619E06|nr:putative integral membrane protein [Theileria parva strain Muguga]KAF5153092.1 putative integral membrane protein [Theileria parva strain Muguga]